MLNKDSLINRLRISALILSLGLAGCGLLRDSSKDFSKTGVHNGFRTYAALDGVGRKASITDTTLTNPTTHNGLGVYFLDNGWFYDIKVDTGLPKNHPLWKYARPDSMENVYATLGNQARGKEQ